MSELARRILYTVCALVIFRLGTFIPLPGTDPAIWGQLFDTQSGGILAGLSSFSGGAIARLAIFALGIMPYLNAALLVQIAVLFSARVRAMIRQGDSGRARLVRWINVLTLILALGQGFGIATALGSVDRLVIAPGLFFQISTTLTLAAGTMFLVWLSQQITLRGLGNGIALIVTVGIVAELPDGFVRLLEIGRLGHITQDAVIGLVIMVAVGVACAVFMESARRNLLVQYPARDVGGRLIVPKTMPLALKLNPAGALVPPLIVSWALAISVQGWTMEKVITDVAGGRLIYSVVYIALMVLAVLLYTARLIDPEQWAADLEKQGATVEGLAPGDPTIAHLDNVISRVTFLGGVYLAVLLIIPDLLVARYQLPFYFDGASLLIVVCTIVDLLHQARGLTRFEGRT